MRALSTTLIAIGALIASVGGYFLVVALPFGTTTITGGLAQQSEFIALSQITAAGGFAFLGGLILVLIGILLRRDGGKP